MLNTAGLARQTPPRQIFSFFDSANLEVAGYPHGANPAATCEGCDGAGLCAECLLTCIFNTLIFKIFLEIVKLLLNL